MCKGIFFCSYNGFRHNTGQVVNVTHPWRLELSKTDVWYAAFGSNLWCPRFLCYIKGGQVLLLHRLQYSPFNNLGLTIIYDCCKIMAIIIFKLSLWDQSSVLTWRNVEFSRFTLLTSCLTFERATFRLRVWTDHVQVQWIRLHQRRFCGELFLIVYFSVVSIPIHGAKEELLFFILKATARKNLTCACIELRELLFSFLSLFFSCEKISSFFLILSTTGSSTRTHGF